MKSYILKRLLYFFPVMIGISIVTYLLINIAPGDPAEIILRSKGVEPNQETIYILREEMGLNKPIYIQYAKWLWNVIHFDLGKSFKTGIPVTEEILYRLPATLELTMGALCITLLIAIPAGIISALYCNSIIDHIARIFALIGASMPSFWIGLLLIYSLAVKMKIFPVMGRGGFEHLVLPAVTLGFSMTAIYARMLRASMLEILGQDFIKVARAKGLKERWIIGRHALKNSLIPIVTLFGMSLGNLLGGSVIVETIFSWPGIGKFIISAILNRDYPVIQGFVLFMAVIFVLINLLVDISYGFIDPRIRYEGGNK